MGGACLRCELSRKKKVKKYYHPLHTTRNTLMRALSDGTDDIVDFLETRFRMHGRKPFLKIFKDNDVEKVWCEVSYSEIWTAVQRILVVMPSLCPLECDGTPTYFGLYTNDLMEWIATEVACMMLRRVPVLIDPDWPEGEVLAILKSTRLQSILCDADTIKTVQKLSSEERPRNIVASGFNLIEADLSLCAECNLAHRPAPVISKRMASDTVAVCFTRGTTRLRKGVNVTNGCMLAHIAALAEIENIRSTDCIWSYQSLAHVFQRNLFYCAVDRGASVCFLKKEEYNKHRDSSIVKMTSIIRGSEAFIREQFFVMENGDENKVTSSLESLRLIFTELEGKDPSFLFELRRMIGNCQIVVGYGLTEALGYVLYWKVGDLELLGGPTGAVEVKSGKEGLEISTYHPFGGYFPNIHPSIPAMAELAVPAQVPMAAMKRSLFSEDNKTVRVDDIVEIIDNGQLTSFKVTQRKSQCVEIMGMEVYIERVQAALSHVNKFKSCSITVKNGKLEAEIYLNQEEEFFQVQTSDGRIISITGTVDNAASCFGLSLRQMPTRYVIQSSSQRPPFTFSIN